MLTLSIMLILIIAIVALILSLLPTICIFVTARRTKLLREEVEFLAEQNDYIIDQLEIIQQAISKSKDNT